MKKDDTMLLIGLGGLGLVVFLNWDKIEEKLPTLPSFGGMPSLDFSSIFEGMQFPSTDLSGILEGMQVPSFDIGKLLSGGMFGVPKLDLTNLGLGLTVPKIPDVVELVKEALGITEGEGEEEVIIAPEPSELTWSNVVKGFVSEHPYITAAIAVPATTALSYGFVKTVPYVAPVIGQAGKAIVSGASKLSSNVYNIIKLPKGITIWKPAIKAITTKGVGGVGLGAGGLAALFFGGLAGATELSRLVGWKPEMVADLPWGLKHITQAITWLSPAETIRGFISPTKAAAMPGIFEPSIIMPTEFIVVPAKYAEAPIAPAKISRITPSGYTEAPTRVATRGVPSGYTEAPIAPAAQKQWVVPSGYREA